MKTIRFPLLALALVVLAPSCADPDRKHGAAAYRTNVVLIGIDTLRTDHLSTYGFPHPISPRIDRLADEGTLYTNAVTTSPWTLPSFASILSGQYPSSHGAGERTGPQKVSGEPPKSPIHGGVPMLPAILREEAGFETALFFDNPYLGDTWGLAHSFGVQHRSREGGRESVERALEWIRSHRNDPFFVLVHLMEPHLPYEPPEPHASRAREWILGDPAPLPEGAAPPVPHGRIRAAYAGEVAYTDHLVGVFVDGLAELGLLDETLLILTSDHGEEFYEHEEIQRRFYNDPREIWGIGHGHTQFQELISAPLILRFPGRVPAGQRNESLVQIHDLAPSILEWQGVEVPESMTGVSLLPTLNGEAVRDHAFTEFILYGDDRRSYREGDWKLILGPDPDTAELYDLANDPGETINLLEDRPDLFQRLARGLLRLERDARELGREQNGGRQEVTIEDDLREELRALGYIQ